MKTYELNFKITVNCRDIPDANADEISNFDIKFANRLKYYETFDEYHIKHNLSAMADIFHYFFTPKNIKTIPSKATRTLQTMPDSPSIIGSGSIALIKRAIIPTTIKIIFFVILPPRFFWWLNQILFTSPYIEVKRK